MSRQLARRTVQDISTSVIAGGGLALIFAGFLASSILLVILGCILQLCSGWRLLHRRGN